jgi:2-iminobutanoate/2-iminopropanoate deaminase
MDKAPVRTENAPAPFQGAPYSQAILFGDLVFVSGQVGLDPESNQVVPGGIREQTEQALRNVGAILEEAGSSMERILKTTIFLVDFGQFADMNEVYARHVGSTPPARATVEIKSLPAGALIEIEAIAHR